VIPISIRNIWFAFLISLPLSPAIAAGRSAPWIFASIGICTCNVTKDPGADSRDSRYLRLSSNALKRVTKGKLPQGISFGPLTDEFNWNYPYLSRVAQAPWNGTDFRMVGYYPFQEITDSCTDEMPEICKTQCTRGLWGLLLPGPYPWSSLIRFRTKLRFNQYYNTNGRWTCSRGPDPSFVKAEGLVPMAEEDFQPDPQPSQAVSSSPACVPVTSFVETFLNSAKRAFLNPGDTAERIGLVTVAIATSFYFRLFPAQAFPAVVPPAQLRQFQEAVLKLPDKSDVACRTTEDGTTCETQDGTQVRFKRVDGVAYVCTES
jgi:hypothetical protein